MLKFRDEARWGTICLVALFGGCANPETRDIIEMSSLAAPSDQRPYAESLKSAKEHFARSDYGLAERDFRAVVEINPTNLTAWIGLAASYDRLRRFDLADRAYERALALGGRTPQYLNNRGYHYLLIGNRKKADEYLQAAAGQDPDNPYIQGNMKLVQTWSDRRAQ